MLLSKLNCNLEELSRKDSEDTMRVITKHSIKYNVDSADARIQGTLNEDVNVAEGEGQRRLPFGSNGKLRYLPMLCP